MENETNTIFDYILWSGTALAVVGMLGLVWCIVIVFRAKRAKLPDEELREAVKAVVPLNLGALFLSAIGLMMVIMGISLG